MKKHYLMKLVLDETGQVRDLARESSLSEGRRLEGLVGPFARQKSLQARLNDKVRKNTIDNLDNKAKREE